MKKNNNKKMETSRNKIKAIEQKIYIYGGILVGTQMMGNIICEYIRELVNEDLDKIAI